MAKRYLLTGAGFTHNFGAPLATEMWALILNHVDGKKAPWAMLQERFFESRIR